MRRPLLWIPTISLDTGDQTPRKPSITIGLAIPGAQIIEGGGVTVSVAVASGVEGTGEKVGLEVEAAEGSTVSVSALFTDTVGLRIPNLSEQADNRQDIKTKPIDSHIIL